MNNSIAIYMRLSNEDTVKQGDVSNSIENQRSLIMNYIANASGLKNCDVLEFVDDGMSGTRFDRPEFLKMIDLAKSGLIQTIITKDYSRLGRDYLEVGKYMETLFPLLHVRYIAINEGYDSDSFKGTTGGMDVGLKNVINMMYSVDASKKVQSARRVLAEEGKFIGSRAPYGYRRSDKNKQQLVPDEETADIVRLIFQMAIDGKKYKEIARYLNKNNIPSSRAAEEQKKGHRLKYKRDSEIRQWSNSVIMRILFDEVYTGAVIYGKTSMNARTGYKSVKNSPEQWIVVENCHEPLISKEDFQKAHKAIKKTSYKKKANNVYKPPLFRCGCCGRAVVHSYGIYKCGAIFDPSKFNCREVRMEEEKLEQTVLSYVRTTSEAMLQELKEKPDITHKSHNENELHRLNSRLTLLEAKKFQIYDDYTRDRITRESMIQQRKAVSDEIEKIKKQIDSFNSGEEEACQNEELKNELSKLSSLEKFDADVLRNLVESIILFDDGNIEIKWIVDDFVSQI